LELPWISKIADMTQPTRSVERTYRIDVNANAMRTFTVRANTGREALEKLKTEGHLYPGSGGWVLDFPGADDTHFFVSVSNESESWVGPGPNGEFADEAG
jgi:hypothetical protein